MMHRSKKEEIVSNIRECLNEANAIFLTNVIGVTSNDSIQLRKELRGVGGKIIVARNTLFRKAAEGTLYEKFLSDLKGTNAVAFSFKEAPSVAKILYDSSKTLEPIQFKGGYLGTSELGAKDVEALAKLPSREQMLATLLATFNAPVSAFVRCLDAIRDQKEKVEA